MLSVAAAAATALLLAAPPAGWFAEVSRATLRRPPDLTLRLSPADARPEPLAERGALARDAGPPPCLGDVCQPVVSVPGYEPRYGRAHRSELFVLALQRAGVEPLATMAWALVSTGLRFDWTPPALEGPNVDPHGWGSVMLRLRVRIDATNHLVFPRRPGDHLPARRSST